MIEWSHFSHFWSLDLFGMVPLCTHAMFSRRNRLKACISLDIIISLTTQRGLMKWQILLEALFMSMFMIFSWIWGKYERKYESTKKSLPDFCWGNILWSIEKKWKHLCQRYFTKILSIIYLSYLPSIKIILQFLFFHQCGTKVCSLIFPSFIKLLN